MVEAISQLLPVIEFPLIFLYTFSAFETAAHFREELHNNVTDEAQLERRLIAPSVSDLIDRSFVDCLIGCITPVLGIDGLDK